MKRNHLFRFLLGVALAAPAFLHAASAPASIGSRIVTIIATSATGNFSPTGNSSTLYNADGTGINILVNGSPVTGGLFPYTYTQSSETTGDIDIVFNGGSFRTKTVLTFTGALTGTYTATLLAGGTGTQSGTFALAVVPATVISTPPPLINMSTRSPVAAGGKLIMGFVVGGTASQTILFRAIGPTLANYGVSGTIGDPMLEVYHSGTSAPIATNDNWGTSTTSTAQQLRDAFASVGAFALTDGSRDAAAILTLEPGSYSVVVSGATPTESGEALVEVYLK